MSKKNKLRIIPLGGLNEIGKNITVFEYGKDIMVVDCGLSFPDDEMFGVDLVIPDISYLIKHKSKIRGVILTHGHEDHIGGLPYFLKEINVPIYGTRLTLGIVANKLKEHNLLSEVTMNKVSAGDTAALGTFKIEFIRSTHSIADSVALAIHTPIGTVIHTGDFKVDYTPIEGKSIDLAKFGMLGERGVLALMSDSTNVERPGHTMSESEVGATFDRIFRECNQRIIVATFASNVHRVQQIFDAAEKYKRKVAISGRSMINIIGVAMELGYMRVPTGLIIDIDDINKYKNNQLVILTTGSQGEPMSALTRMAYSDHKKVEIRKGDLVILSATPIPGNEKLVSNVVNELFKKGADVIYESIAAIHASGHACQEELKLIYSLVRPKYFIPVHGEYKHLKRHANLVAKMGMNPDNIFIMDIGKIIEITSEEAKITGAVPSGQILVDGLRVGDVGSIVLKDRKHLSQDGLIVIVATISSETGELIAGPDIISRGFVYVREAEELMEDVKDTAKKLFDNCKQKNITDWTTIKIKLRNGMSDYLYDKIKRSPMILPVLMEV